MGRFIVLVKLRLTITCVYKIRFQHWKFFHLSSHKEAGTLPQLMLATLVVPQNLNKKCISNNCNVCNLTENKFIVKMTVLHLPIGRKEFGRKACCTCFVV
jgi:hypothetical protein